MAIYSRRLTEARGYLIAVATTLAAVEIRWLLEQWLVGYLPLISLFPAVAVSVWFGGYGPALVATILGYLACSYLVIEPRGLAIPIGVAQWVGLISYLFSCGAIIAMGEGLHSARRRAEANQLEAWAHLKQLEAEVVERKQAEAELRGAEERSRSVDRGGAGPSAAGCGASTTALCGWTPGTAFPNKPQLGLGCGKGATRSPAVRRLARTARAPGAGGSRHSGSLARMPPTLRGERAVPRHHRAEPRRSVSPLFSEFSDPVFADK